MHRLLLTPTQNCKRKQMEFVMVNVYYFLCNRLYFICLCIKNIYSLASSVHLSFAPKIIAKFCLVILTHLNRNVFVHFISIVPKCFVRVAEE